MATTVSEERIVEMTQADEDYEGHISGNGTTVLGEELNGESRDAATEHWWNSFFILICAFSVFNDPMFCYINSIDDEHKCINIDKKLAWTYIYCRSVTDVFYLIDSIITLCGCFRWNASSFDPRLGNLLSILSRFYVSVPITQVLVAMLFIKSGSAPVIFFILMPVQFVLRIYHLYDSLTRRSIIDITPVERWFRPILGFVPFILASHHFGAFWYHLAIHAQTLCWLSTRHLVYPEGFHMELSSSSFLVTCKANLAETYPKGSKISRWDDICPVKQADPKTYDFGIYFFALQSDVASSTHHILKRMLQSFWWGLRNLSSFGSSLNSSMDTLEIFFSVLISISGMALFLVYFNARIQEYQERSSKLILEEKMQRREPDINLWLSNNNLEMEMKSMAERKKNLKTVIMENIHKIDEEKDLDLQNVLSILDKKDKLNIMRSLFLPSLEVLTGVPVLKKINENGLESICRCLVQVTYNEGSKIVQEGEPFGKVLFIAQGTAVIYSKIDGSSNEWLNKGALYGKELLNCAFNSPQFPALPISTRSVTALVKVDAFAIRACDLKILCSQTLARQLNTIRAELKAAERSD